MANYCCLIEQFWGRVLGIFWGYFGEEFYSTKNKRELISSR